MIAFLLDNGFLYYYHISEKCDEHKTNEEEQCVENNINTNYIRSLENCF